MENMQVFKTKEKTTKDSMNSQKYTDTTPK